MASNIVPFPRRGANDNFEPLPPTGPAGVRFALRRFLSEMTGQDTGPIEPEVWQDRSWSAAMSKPAARDMVIQGREDAQGALLVLAAMLSMSPQEMATYIAGRSGQDVVHSLYCLNEYRERIESITDLASSAIARLFAMTLEVHAQAEAA